MTILRPGGIDVIYMDESARYPNFFATVVRIPFLRQKDNLWRFVWQESYDLADQWRRSLSKAHQIRFRQELHAHEILGRKGLLHKEHRNLTVHEANSLYSDALSSLNFLENDSIFTVSATADSDVLGNRGMDACLVTMFQRLKRQAEALKTNGIMFFDEGHKEYIRQFRKARNYLPTGSAYGSWGDGRPTKNMPLDMFPKDANIKHSDLSYFIQMADLIVYAAKTKIEFEKGILTAKRIQREHHLLYDQIDRRIINAKVTTSRNDGILIV
jgi:Protein of unknown function (DUF3800)